MYKRSFVSGMISIGILNACANAQTTPPPGSPDTPIVIDLRAKQTEKDSPLALPAGSYILELRRAADGKSFDAILNGRNSVPFDQRLQMALRGCTTTRGIKYPLTAEVISKPIAGRPLANALEIIVPIREGGSGCELFGVTTISSQPAHLHDSDPDLCCPSGGGVESKTPPGELPDLEPIKVTIAGKSIRWARTQVLSSDQAQTRSEGRCVFPYSLTTANQGVTASSATENRVALNLPTGAQLDSHALPGLAPENTFTHNGQLALPPGNWAIWFMVDEIGAVSETTDANNRRKVNVTIEGSCD